MKRAENLSLTQKIVGILKLQHSVLGVLYTSTPSCCTCAGRRALKGRETRREKGNERVLRES